MANQPEISRQKQKIGGIIIFLLGLGGIIFTWYTAVFHGYFYRYAALVFPPFMIVGLGLILFPDYKTERIQRGEDISQMEGISLFTPRWWIILIIGLLAGFANFALLYFGGK